MRTRRLVLLAVLLAAAATAGAATDSAIVYASLTVQETLTVDLSWMTTGTDTIDLGTIDPDSYVVEQLRMRIDHNLDPATNLDISMSVDKTAGPVDNGELVIIDNPDLFSGDWVDGGWGTATGAYLSGSAQSYTYDFDCTFLVYPGATPSVRTYEITATVTSL